MHHNQEDLQKLKKVDVKTVYFTTEDIQYHRLKKGQRETGGRERKEGEGEENSTEKQ